MTLKMHIERILRIVSILTMLSNVECFPYSMCPPSPCPMNFHYEFDGFEWFGIIKIYPQIYNRFHTDRITLNITLMINRRMENFQNLNWLQLKKSLEDTYQDIDNGRPILYRVNFPFRDNCPHLLSTIVNGLPQCTNYRIFPIIPSQIHLGYTLYLQKIEELDIDQEPKQNQHCGTYDEDVKYIQLISGGDKIKNGTWPWGVAIYRTDSKAGNLVFQCTGSLISNRLVLTAAHCFKTDSKKDIISTRKITLAFGRHDIRKWAEKNMLISDVQEIIIHPDYLSHKESTIFDADIAILITKEFIQYTTVIRPICLWPTSVDSTYSLVGTNGTMVGWGQPFDNIDENVPRQLTLPVVRKEHCFPSKRPTSSTRIFCAGSEKPGYSPCNGDSGSAFAIHVNGAWFLRGLVSAALGDPILNYCYLNTYTIFTDIVHYRDWIDEIESQKSL